MSIFIGYNGRKEAAAMKEYIANELKADKESDPLSMFDWNASFKGSK